MSPPLTKGTKRAEEFWLKIVLQKKKRKKKNPSVLKGFYKKNKILKFLWGFRDICHEPFDM